MWVLENHETVLVRQRAIKRVVAAILKSIYPSIPLLKFEEYNKIETEKYMGFCFAQSPLLGLEPFFHIPVWVVLICFIDPIDIRFKEIRCLYTK